MKTNFEEKLSFESTDEKTANEIILLVKSKEDKVFNFLIRFKSIWTRFMRTSQIIMLSLLEGNYQVIYIIYLVTGTKMNWNLNQLGMGNK